MDLSTNKQLSFGMDFILSHDCNTQDTKPDLSDDRLSVRSFSDDSFRSSQTSPSPSPDLFRSGSVTPNSDRSNSVSPPVFAPSSSIPMVIPPIFPQMITFMDRQVHQLYPYFWQRIYEFGFRIQNVRC